MIKIQKSALYRDPDLTLKVAIGVFVPFSVLPNPLINILSALFFPVSLKYEIFYVTEGGRGQIFIEAIFKPILVKRNCDIFFSQDAQTKLFGQARLRFF